MLLRLFIDTKSLYFNIKNDNASGHTAMVATPLKQYNSWNNDLLDILKIPENIDTICKESIIDKILSKSRSEVKINKVFVFDKVAVNGELLINIPAFCMYIREEIAEGYVHNGRQKLHYPTSFKYTDNEIEINNNVVLKTISEMLHNYAFVVEGFEYDTNSRTLNFKATIVGSNLIPYSKVFVNKKGVGNKFLYIFNDISDSYDAEIIALRESLGYDKVSPDNFFEIMEENRLIANQYALQHISSQNGVNIRLLTDYYPYALYDYEYEVSGKKYFIIVRYTSTKIPYFNLSMQKIRFINDFYENTKVLLVTDINNNPKYQLYTLEELNNFAKNINSVCYRNVEED